MKKEQEALYREWQEVSRKIRDYMNEHPTGLKDQYVQSLGARRKVLRGRMKDLDDLRNVLSLKIAENTLDHQEQLRWEELKKDLQNLHDDTMRDVRKRFK